MNTVSSGTPTLRAADLTAARHEDPKKIAEAAGQFEAFLLTEMLKSVRNAGSGDWMGGEDASGSALSEMAQEQFAQALASSGGLGIARMVVRQLDPVS